MSARIFSVSITVTTLVEAQNSDHADLVAKQCFREIVKDTKGRDLLVDVMAEITSLESLPDGWGSICLPYGGDGETCLNKILPERAR